MRITTVDDRVLEGELISLDAQAITLSQETGQTDQLTLLRDAVSRFEVYGGDPLKTAGLVAASAAVVIGVIAIVQTNSTVDTITPPY